MKVFPITANKLRGGPPLLMASVHNGTPTLPLKIVAITREINKPVKHLQKAVTYHWKTFNLLVLK